MGFSLQAVDARGRNLEEMEYLSYPRRTWRELVRIIENAPTPAREDEEAVFYKLTWNHGDLVTPEECRWIADRFTNADRERIIAGEWKPEELLGLADEVKAFCERCAARGGFEVW